MKIAPNPLSKVCGSWHSRMTWSFWCLSRVKLEKVLCQLDQEMGKFNLQMSWQKTEIMMFRPHASPFPTPDPVSIRSNSLKDVTFFSYLGVHVSQTGSLVDHGTPVAQRARVSALMTVNLLQKLAIHSIPRLKCYFLSFIQSQFYALKMLPLSILPKIGTLFLRNMFRLPPCTPSELFYVLFPSFTPAILCLRRRLAFFRRCLRHNLKCVTSSFLLDATNSYNMTCGWMHDSFLLFRSVETSAQYCKFDFLAGLRWPPPRRRFPLNLFGIRHQNVWRFFD